MLSPRYASNVENVSHPIGNEHGKIQFLPKHATHIEQSLFLFSLKSKLYLETFNQPIININSGRYGQLKNGQV